jgi:hypothetical protein
MRKFILLLVFNITSNLIAAEIILETFDVDLNLDKVNEKIQLGKKNGLDTISILKNSNEAIFTHELTPMGKNSQVRKFSHLKINLLQQCLLFHYFEGQTGVVNHKRSLRLLSFCYHTANLTKISVQDLGYLYWDLKSVASYMQLNGNLNIKSHVNQGVASALLTLKQENRSRSWQFNTLENAWYRLPERMYAEYGIKPAR